LVRFAFDAERRYRAGLEPFDADFSAAFLADAVLALAEALQGFLDFKYQLSLSVANTKNRIAVRFHRRPIRRIRKILIVIHGLYGFAGFRAKLGDPLIKKISEELNILLLHKRPSARFRANTGLL
jgi:hypothetical protein